MRLAGVILAGLGLAGAVTLAAGPRAGLLVAVGIGLGATLEGLRFGFAGPWRLWLVERDARGLLAQLLAIALIALVAFPLIAGSGGELMPAHAPVGPAMIAGAFVFGAAMQVVMGCGSGTLVNAGSGNAIGALALAGFIAGSFLGSLHLGFWTGLGSLPLISAQSVAGTGGGLVLTWLALAGVAAWLWRRADPAKRRPPARLYWAAGLVAALALANLVISGQPWGVVYGLGLWGAKIAQAGGLDLASHAFWSAPAHAERLQQSVLTDVTSLTNIGLIAGAMLILHARRDPGAPVAPLALRGWVGVVLAGIVLGYSARLAFGCNVGAFLSGISTGSLHGWVWFAAAMAGSSVGLRLRGTVLVPRGVPA
jgi:uncharacterized membrane protein YedE/YeeE